MVAKVQKWGNSQGLRVSKQILEDAHIAVGDEVDVSVSDGTIVITPVARVRGKVDLRKLVAKMPKGRRSKEVDWGAPSGKEAW